MCILIDYDIIVYTFIFQDITICTLGFDKARETSHRRIGMRE